jgi:hypothetical protein
MNNLKKEGKTMNDFDLDMNSMHIAKVAIPLSALLSSNFL